MQTNQLMQNDIPLEYDVSHLSTDERQLMASDPRMSVWVSASAGTGKTAVLTRRVLRLLMPRPDGSAGTAAYKILCLTFTKAAAAEMKLRITDTLAKWATLALDGPTIDAPSLRNELTKLLGRPPQDFEILAARRLFAAVVDTPGGLKIMTIHAFCTSILGTFPLEAGLQPQFKTLEDGPASALMTQARNQILEEARKNPQSTLAKSLQQIAQKMNEEDFNQVLTACVSERLQLIKLLKETGSPEGYHLALCKELNLDPNQTLDDLAQQFITSPYEDIFRTHVSDFLAVKTATDRKRGEIFAKLYDPATDRLQMVGEYIQIFLKKDLERPAKLLNKEMQTKAPDLLETMEKEQERLLKLIETKKRILCAQSTLDLFRIASAILARYQSSKIARAALDFDDLIARTLDLLRSENIVPWVMYKLDGGIDHILVDEAQDTNPEQWEIIRLLSSDFFTGDGAHTGKRTIFAVGDEKQSIYGFQRAAPEQFGAMCQYFGAQVLKSQQPWRIIPLDMSFRTVPPVLDLVDATFQPPEMRRGLGGLNNAAPQADALKHYSFRKDQGGLVSLWPIFASPDLDKDSLWSPPIEAGDSFTASAVLAQTMAQTIAGWLNPNDPEILISQNRPVHAGDIMILVRRRTAFVNQLIRALKLNNVPVGGADRMILGEQLVVRDLLAVAQFALLPHDSLNFACVLKSPFIGMVDEDFATIAHERAEHESLWDACNRVWPQDHPALIWLNAKIISAKTDHPFDFFSKMIQETCPAPTHTAILRSGQYAITQRLGEDALDPLEEFLSASLSYEGENIAALQDFVMWMHNSEQTIKRDLEEAGGNVRIMTVHGSKGLQAPIVILPDTLRFKAGSSRAGDSLLWPEKSNLPLAIWAPRSHMQCDYFLKGRENIKQKDLEEYRRLLYVAMTRAEDRLYVMGHRNKSNPDPNSWYIYIEDAFNALGAEAYDFAMPSILQTSQDQIANDEPAANATSENAYSEKRITHKQTGPFKKASVHSIRTEAIKYLDETDTNYAWMLNEPKAEPLPPTPLIPSRYHDEIDDQDPASQSPLVDVSSTSDLPSYQRGTMMHRLLQILPDIDIEQRETLGRYWLDKNLSGSEWKDRNDLRSGIIENMLQPVLRIVNHPTFAPLFGPQAIAEVPVTGLTDDNQIISGQIDRLVVHKNEVWIVDYKTNQKPPRTARQIPYIYVKQMRAYRHLLSKIYPSMTIKTYLIYTEGPHIMEVAP
jgi:ATP-dependent helicase/nuclease subunit A